MVYMKLTASLNRTTFTWITVIALALGLGLGASWWQQQAGPAQHSDAPSQLFAQRYRDVTGQPQALRPWRGKLLVVNFWATWCAPCIKEMPELQRISDEFAAQGVHVLGLGIDTLENIQAFAQKHQIRFPLYAAERPGLVLAQAFGNQERILPYTLIILPNGTVAQTKVGPIHAAELRSWLGQHLPMTLTKSPHTSGS